MKNILNTEEIKLLMPDYVTGSLSEEENSAVKYAIENSNELKELYFDIKNALEFTSSAEFEEPPPQYWNNLLPRIHQNLDAQKQHSLAVNPFSYLWKILVPVAAVILIFIIYRISYDPEQDITQKQDNNVQQEDIVTKDTVKKEIETLRSGDSIEFVKTYNNTVPRNKKYVKKYNIEQFENYEFENFAETNILVNENGQKSEFASLAIDELTIFGAGAPGMLDEDLNDELEKLNDADHEKFLKELKSNL